MNFKEFLNEAKWKDQSSQQQADSRLQSQNRLLRGAEKATEKSSRARRADLRHFEKAVVQLGPRHLGSDRGIKKQLKKGTNADLVASQAQADLAASRSDQGRRFGRRAAGERTTRATGRVSGPAGSQEKSATHKSRVADLYRRASMFGR